MLTAPLDKSSEEYQKASTVTDDLFSIWTKLYRTPFEQSGSNYEALVKSLLFISSYQLGKIENLSNNFSIGGSSEDFVTFMEEWLGIPCDSELTLAVRKANILTRMNGYAATPNNIKSVLSGVIPADSYELVEMFKESNRYDEAFTYKVKLLFDATDPNYTELVDSIPSVTSLIEQIHPAHCRLLVEFTPTIEDTMGLSDEGVATGVHTEAIWDSNDGWVSGDNPLEGHIWA